LVDKEDGKISYSKFRVKFIETCGHREDGKIKLLSGQNFSWFVYEENYPAESFAGSGNKVSRLRK
jgi:hypothetical protein